MLSCVGSNRPETQRIHCADRPRAHGEDVADDATDAGGRSLERLDRAGMVVRLDFERDREPVADVDDAGVFLARAHEDALRSGRKRFEQWPGAFVRAMLAPHDRENCQLGVVRVAPEDFPDALVFLRRQAVFFDKFGSDGGFGHQHLKVQDSKANYSSVAIRLEETNRSLFRGKSTVNSVAVVVTNLNLIANDRLIGSGFFIILDEGDGRLYGRKLARRPMQGQDTYRLDSSAHR